MVDMMVIGSVLSVGDKVEIKRDFRIENLAFRKKNQIGSILLKGAIGEIIEIEDATNSNSLNQVETVTIKLDTGQTISDVPTWGVERIVPKAGISDKKEPEV